MQRNFDDCPQQSIDPQLLCSNPRASSVTVTGEQHNRTQPNLITTLDPRHDTQPSTGPELPTLRPILPRATKLTSQSTTIASVHHQRVASHATSLSLDSNQPSARSNHGSRLFVCNNGPSCNKAFRCLCDLQYADTQILITDIACCLPMPIASIKNHTQNLSLVTSQVAERDSDTRKTSEDTKFQPMGKVTREKSFATALTLLAYSRRKTGNKCGGTIFQSICRGGMQAALMCRTRGVPILKSVF